MRIEIERNSDIIYNEKYAEYDYSKRIQRDLDISSRVFIGVALIISLTVFYVLFKMYLLSEDGSNNTFIKWTLLALTVFVYTPTVYAVASNNNYIGRLKEKQITVLTCRITKIDKQYGKHDNSIIYTDKGIKIPVCGYGETILLQKQFEGQSCKITYITKSKVILKLQVLEDRDNLIET